MATDNDALVVKIKADIKSLQAGLRQAAREADITGKQMQDSLGGSAQRVQLAVANMVDNVGAGLVAITGAAVLAGGAFAALTRRSLDFADSLVKASDMTGLGVEALQEYRFAAKQAGVENEELEQGLALYTKRLGEARNGNQEAVKSFAALGISQEQLKNSSAEETLQRVFSVLETIPDAADRAAYANEVFGKSGLRVALLAGQGAGALEEMRNRARELGLVVGDELVRAGDDAGDSIDSLKAVIESGLNKAVLQAAPDIKAFMDEITSDPERIQQVASALVSVALAGAQVAAALVGALSYARDFGEWIAKIQGYSEIPYAKEIEELESKIASVNANPLNFLKGPYYVQQMLATYGNQLDELREKQAALLKPAISTPPPASSGGGTSPAPKLGSLGSDGAAKAAERARQQELASQQKQNAALIQQTQEFVATEAALEEMRYQTRRQALLAINADEFGGEKSKNDLIEQLADKHQATMDQITSQGMDRQRAAHEAVLAQLEAAVLDQETRELIAEEESYAAKVALLKDAQDAEIEALGGYNAIKEQLWQEHQDALNKIQQEALDQRVQAEIDAATRQFSFTQFAGNKEQRYTASLFNQALALGSSHNKKIFELQKKLNLAQAIIALPTAVMDSYKNAGGFPLGIPAAAAMTGIGLANIAAIASAQYGGGASSSLPGAAAAGGGVVGDTNQPGTGGGSSAPQISLNLVGDNFSRDQVRGLIEQINEALSDGATLRTT